MVGLECDVLSCYKLIKYGMRQGIALYIILNNAQKEKIIFKKEKDKMEVIENRKFEEISDEDELLNVDGGVFGVDDAALVTAFLAAMAIGAAVGANRKNRK